MTEITTTRWWTSPRVGRLHTVIAIAMTVLLFRVAMEEDLTWLAGVVIVGVISIATVIRWPYGALLVLIAMSTMPVYFVELFQWKARPEHFAALIVSVAVCIWLFYGKHALLFERLDYWLLAFVIINFISSAVGSTTPASTLRWALQNGLAIVPYFLIRVLIRDLTTLRKAFWILLAVMSAECAYGIFCFVSYHVFSTTFGMSIGQYLVDVSPIFASMYEPNLFGAYSASCAVIWLGLALLGRNRLLSTMGFLAGSLATVLSYSRATLVALLIISSWMFWKTRHSRRGVYSKLIMPVLGLTLVFVIVFYAAGGVIQKRFEDLYYEGLTEPTAISRVLIIYEAILEVPAHPLLGSGTASFNISFDWNRYIPEWASDKTWIGNAPLRVIHDTGLIGLIVFLGFFVSVWGKLRQLWQGVGVSDGLVLGLAAGFLLYGITFEFTDGTILAFFWIHLGFLASAAILYDKISPSTMRSLTNRMSNIPPSI